MPSAADALDRHNRAYGAFAALRAMGAHVVDGPMFTGRIHGPWRPTDTEWRWCW